MPYYYNILKRLNSYASISNPHFTFHLNPLDQPHYSKIEYKGSNLYGLETAYITRIKLILMFSLEINATRSLFPNKILCPPVPYVLAEIFR